MPVNSNSDAELPRSQTERLASIKKRIDNGYYETKKIRVAVAEAFIDPSPTRRAKGS